MSTYATAHSLKAPLHLLQALCRTGWSPSIVDPQLVYSSWNYTQQALHFTAMKQDNLVVVHDRFVVAQAVQLKLKEMMSWSGDDFEITELTTRAPWFKVKGKTFSMRDKKELLDSYGNIVATMRNKHACYEPRIASSGAGFHFEVRSPLFYSETTAHYNTQHTMLQASMSLKINLWSLLGECGGPWSLTFNCAPLASAKQSLQTLTNIMK